MLERKRTKERPEVREEGSVPGCRKDQWSWTRKKKKQVDRGLTLEAGWTWDCYSTEKVHCTAQKQSNQEIAGEQCIHLYLAGPNHKGPPSPPVPAKPNTL